MRGDLPTDRKVRVHAERRSGKQPVNSETGCLPHPVVLLIESPQRSARRVLCSPPPGSYKNPEGEYVAVSVGEVFCAVVASLRTASEQASALFVANLAGRWDQH